MKTIHTYIALLLLTVGQASFAQKWEQMGEDIPGEVHLGEIGRSFDINGNGKIIAVGYLGRFGGNSVKVFGFKNNHWEQVGDTIREQEKDSDFGNEVSINDHGNIIGISAFKSNKNASECGNFKVYSYQNNKWQTIGDIYGLQESDELGIKIQSSADGEVFAVGMENKCGEDYICSQINVYQKKDSIWLQKGNVIAPGFPNSIAQHFSMDKTGNTIAYSWSSWSELDASNFAYIEVLKFKGNQWQKTGKTISINTGSSDWPQLSLSENGDYLIAGFPNFKSDGKVVSGQTRVYQLSNTDHVQIGESIKGENKYDYFGSYVDINNQGDVIGIGTINGPNQVNRYVKVYKLKDGNWSQVGQTLDGAAVKLNNEGNIVAVGKTSANNLKGVLRIYRLE